MTVYVCVGALSVCIRKYRVVCTPRNVWCSGHMGNEVMSVCVKECETMCVCVRVCVREHVRLPVRGQSEDLCPYTSGTSVDLQSLRERMVNLYLTTSPL